MVLNKLYQKGGTPLIIDQPYNLVVLFSTFSPIFLIGFITSLSFLFQNVKGLIYLCFIFGIVMIRNFIYYTNGIITSTEVNGLTNQICDAVQYTKYGNNSFSTFIFAFSLIYMFLPMFINNSPNYWIFSSLIAFFFLDIFLKMFNGCYKSISYTEFLLNIILGASIGTLIVSLMYIGKASQYLFFNELGTGKEVCNVPNKQTFKCAVYKNGEIIGKI